MGHDQRLDRAVLDHCENTNVVDQKSLTVQPRDCAESVRHRGKLDKHRSRFVLSFLVDFNLILDIDVGRRGTRRHRGVSGAIFLVLDHQNLLDEAVSTGSKHLKDVIGGEKIEWKSRLKRHVDDSVWLIGLVQQFSVL